MLGVLASCHGLLLEQSGNGGHIWSLMKVDGKSMRTIWLEPDGWSVGVIDQTALPHRFATVKLTSLDDADRKSVV